jgi:hypothetical protein
MEVGIFRIDLGFDQCYVLKSDGVIVVDAGAPGKGKQFAQGLERVSIPWGKMFIGIQKLFMPLITISPVKVDVLLEDEGLPLAGFGIPGKVLHTPGHTPGSVNVLRDAGEAFVGDLAMNRFPLRFFPGLPIFADDLDAVSASWQLLLAQGARTVYPAHGKPFPSEVIQRALS